MNDVVLAMQGIDKQFAGVHALRQVDLDLRKAEILALVGENGAGKSTLMKILTGIYTRDRGEVSYMGEAFKPRHPRHAMELGLGIIHQELNLLNHLTVAENIFIGRESMQKNRILLDKNHQNKKTEELFQKLNMNIDPREQLGNLSVGMQQMVEIARAVSHNLKVLILDEPSAALTEKEISALFTIMREMKNNGVSMIYISHRLEEIHQIADRTTVLRDGEVIGTQNTADITKADIINMMVGRTIYEQPKTKSTVPVDSKVVLKVRSIHAGPQVNDISFELHQGEILGFAGLIGAGRTETARAIFGADLIKGGEIEVAGKVVHIHSPEQAVALGIGYLSEDRKRYGLAVDLNVRDNTMLSSYNLFQKSAFISLKNSSRLSQDYVNKLKIKTPSLDKLVRELSGGNQQKVVLAKWLVRDSKILIFDEPTRGIDVGAKSEIYALMRELVAMGKSIIMISSELPEILRMSDRIAVLCEGRLTGILDIADANQEKIIELATMRGNQISERSVNHA